MAGTRKTATGRSSATTRSHRSAVEAGLVDHLQTQLHGRVDERDAGEGEQGTGVQPPTARPVRLDRADHGAVGVADRHPLGPAGSARGVEDVGEVVGLARGLEGRAVAGDGLAPSPVRGPGSRPASRSRPPSRRRSARRGGPPPPPGRCRPARRRPPPRSRPSGPARVPPRPGPGGGSWAPPPRRPGGPPSTRRASARRARDAGGCRRGRPARGRHRGGVAPGHWRRRPTRRTSWSPRRRPRRPSGRRTPGPYGPGGRPSAWMRIPPSGWSVRQVDAGVRFVAAWPMRLRGSIPG